MIYYLDWLVRPDLSMFSFSVQEECGMYNNGKKVHVNKAWGSEMAGFITDPMHICAALLVFLQHSFVAVLGGSQKIWLGAMRQPLRYRPI